MLHSFFLCPKILADESESKYFYYILKEVKAGFLDEEIQKWDFLVIVLSSLKEFIAFIFPFIQQVQCMLNILLLYFLNFSNEIDQMKLVLMFID